MNFTSIRIITENPPQLADFYQAITGITPTWSTPDFAELALPSGTLAIAHQRTTDRFNAGAARAAHNQSVIIEFLVDDVDQTYLHIKAHLNAVVQEPTTQPWGNRSLLFRDPDGNLVNCFTPVSEEARAKFRV